MNPSEAQPTVLAVRAFSFRVGKKEILRDVSFSVARGEYVSIVGPNGAGKTTLLKCIDRLLEGGTGQIEVLGRPLPSYRQKELAQCVAYVPQADGRVIPFTVRQFVLMGRYPYASPFSSIDREGHRAVEEALERTGTARFAERRLDTLSGGERQKVYLAAALAQGAQLLLLDEPTTFLDYRHQAEIRDLLSRLHRESRATILCVTHDLNRAALDSDRIVALADGTVRFDGPPAHIMNAEVLQRLYQTPFVLTTCAHAPLPLIVPTLPPGCRP